MVLLSQAPIKSCLSRMEAYPLSELQQLSGQTPDYERENRLLISLMETITNDPLTLFNSIAAAALELTPEESAGVSLLAPESPDYLRWCAATGLNASQVDRCMPREGTPCGEALQTNNPLLLRSVEPDGYQLIPHGLPVFETFVMPFSSQGKPRGTIWVVTHTPGKRFDRETGRILTNLRRIAELACSRNAIDLEANLPRDTTRTLIEATHQISNTEKLCNKVGIGIGTFEWDIVQRRLWWSPTTEAIWGMAPGEFKGTLDHWRRLVHPGDLKRINHDIKTFISGKNEFFGTQHRIIHLNGVERRVLVRARTIRSLNGQALRMEGVYIDITEGSTETEQSGPSLAQSIQASAKTGEQSPTHTLLSNSRTYSSFINSHSQGKKQPFINKSCSSLSTEQTLKLPNQASEPKVGMKHLLDKAKTELQILIDLMPFSMAIFDNNMNYLGANDQWLLDHGMLDRKILGCSHYDVYPETSLRWKEIYRKGLSGQDEHVEAERSVDADGQEHWRRWRVRPWYSGQGVIGGIVIFTEEITARMQAETALRANEERLRLALRGSNVGLCDWDLRSNNLIFSPEWKRWLGYDENEVPNHASEWKSRIHPDDLKPTIKAIQQIIQGPRSAHEMEYRMRHRNGSWRWIYTRAEVFRDQEGTAVRMLGCQLDVTKRKELEQSLSDREARLIAILNFAADAIITIDRNGIIQTVNAATERLFGYHAHEMIGANVKMLMPPVFAENHDMYIRRHIETGENRLIGRSREVAGQRKDGTEFPIELSVSEIDHLQQFIGILRDITRRRELELEVVEVASLEQRRIGQDLHDTLSQELTAIGIHTVQLHHALKTDYTHASEIANKIDQGIRRSQTQLRSMIRGLVPVSVETEGLMVALSELAERTEQTHQIPCHFECSESIELADNSIAIHMYLIAQEAVHNALKHANPKSITIQLKLDQNLQLSILDDGVGFPGIVQSLRPQSLGLRIMRNRAAIIGATLTIRPVEPSGTQILCILSELKHVRGNESLPNSGSDRR